MSEAQEDTRRLILRIADALFARHGYAAVSMSAIIDEMSKVRKVTKGTLYYYFEDKEALFVAVLQEQIMAHGRLIEEAGATEGDLPARITAIAAAMQRVHPHEFVRVRADIDL